MKSLISISGLLLLAIVIGTAVVATSPSGKLAILGQSSLLPAAATSAQSVAQSSQAVQAALQSHILAGDDTALQGTVISGVYALQIWGDGDIAGQALLQYDPTQNQWSLVSWGGGMWSADELVQLEGVPQDTAAALVAGVQTVGN